MKITDNKTIFGIVRDTLKEGTAVSVSVRGQSMLPFFRSGSTILLRPISGEDLRCGQVVLGENADGTFVVHRIIEVTDSMVLLLGDGNTVGTERIPREQIYGIVDCGRIHLFLARIWLWMRPVRKYPLWFLKRMCGK